MDNIEGWKNYIIENSPKIIVELTFNYDETDYYAMELLNGCLYVDEDEKYSYKIKFEYSVKKEKEYLESAFKEVGLEVETGIIDYTMGAHCGPRTLAVFYRKK